MGLGLVLREGLVVGPSNPGMIRVSFSCPARPRKVTERSPWPGQNRGELQQHVCQAMIAISVLCLHCGALLNNTWQVSPFSKCLVTRLCMMFLQESFLRQQTLANLDRGAASASVAISDPVTQSTFLHKGPFTHAIFDAISDAILHTKRALPYPARMSFSRSIAWIGKKVITLFKATLLSNSCSLDGISLQRYATKSPCGVGWGRFCTQNCTKIASKSHEKSHV